MRRGRDLERFDTARFTRDGCTFVEAVDQNGFCIECDSYEQPKTAVDEADGKTYYLIDNACKLYRFADKVNNDNANYGAANAKRRGCYKINSFPVTKASQCNQNQNGMIKR